MFVDEPGCRVINFSGIRSEFGHFIDLEIRDAGVDTGAYVVTNRPWVHKTHKLKPHMMILPDCGIRMIRCLKPERPRMPDSPYALYQMFDAALASDDLVATAGSSPEKCLHCKTDREMDPTPVNTCSLCLSDLHDRCRIPIISVAG